MLQKEFENLIGQKVSNDEYVVANGLYEATDMNKQEFCEAYKRLKGEKLVWELKKSLDHREARCRNALNDVSKLKDECFRLKGVMKDVADSMLSCFSYDDIEVVNHCLYNWVRVLLPNVFDVIKGKCKYGIMLTKEELETLEVALDGMYLDSKDNEVPEDDLAAIDKNAIG